MSIFGLRSNGLASSAYKNLSRAQTSLTDNISRLASGLRITKTADDSAGSNVSVRMGNQVSGMAQANRNAQDTNNLLATAESGLSDISDILGKMRELSVQASTDTLNDADRASINLEFQALKDELTRIANVTEYNGMNVLNGTYQTAGGVSSQWPLPETSITRVNVHTNGTQGNHHSYQTASGDRVSADGRYVAFRSEASNLVDGDTNGVWDTFVHDRETGTTERISVHSNGTQGNSGSHGWPAISDDGRYVSFGSLATNLVDGGDANEHTWDIFVHDRETGATELISAHSNGTQGNSGSHDPNISADGRYVAFDSHATNLVDNDTNGTTPDIFVHDRETGTTELVSVNSNGTQGNDRSYLPSISADGRYLTFHSEATNLVDGGDTNGSNWDVFIHDRETGATELISAHSNGTQGNSGSHWPSISADGRYVAFDSHASNLVDGDTNGTTRDVFVHDRETGTTELISVHSNGTQANGHNSHFPSISADGRYVAFDSLASNLVDNDTNGTGWEGRDVFIHDRETGATERVSVDANGTQANHESRHPSISADGRTILFGSVATNLMDGDTNGKWDVFVVNNPLYDATGAGGTGGTDGTAEGSETWNGSGPESLFNAVNDEGYVGDQAADYYDQVQPGTSDSSDAHGPPDNIRGHWRVQIGADNDVNSQHEFSLTNATANGLDLEDDNVLSVDDARTAITAIDHAIDEVNRERSYIGSEQNKLQFTMSNLSSNIQNIEASRSSIEDADFAAEAADLAKNQILAQSATAMLAQASAISQNVLGLLS